MVQSAFMRSNSSFEAPFLEYAYVGAGAGGGDRARRLQRLARRPLGVDVEDEALIVPIVCMSCSCMRFIENSRLERSSGAVFVPMGLSVATAVA
jgi:hypothetical protein